MKERNARIHGTFTSEAVRNFDEFKPESEQYSFIGNVAVSQSWTSSKNNQAEDRHPKPHRNSATPKKIKKLGVMIKILN